VPGCVERPQLRRSGMCENACAMTTALVPLHMGSLHPFEQAMVLLLAFGPFVVLAIVVYVVRGRDVADEEQHEV